MSLNKTDIIIYADWRGMNSPKRIGILTAQQAKGRKAFSFEYDLDWLNAKEQRLLGIIKVCKMQTMLLRQYIQIHFASLFTSLQKLPTTYIHPDLLPLKNECKPSGDRIYLSDFSPPN